MAQIIKQQQNLCALFAAASLFCPDVEFSTLDKIISEVKINVKSGMTLYQENKVIEIFTEGSLQLEPLYVNLDRTIQLWKFKRLLLIRKGIHYKDARVHPLALTVKILNGLNESLHRIVVVNFDNKKFIVIDTMLEHTQEFHSIEEVYNKYDITAVWCFHSVSESENIYFGDGAFNHLLS